VDPARILDVDEEQGGVVLLLLPAINSPSQSDSNWTPPPEHLHLVPLIRPGLFARLSPPSRINALIGVEQPSPAPTLVRMTSAHNNPYKATSPAP
jgi:hypothetical protein